MPELPEVEVTRRLIEPLVVGRPIRRVRTTAPSYLFVTAPDVLVRRLPGRRCTEVTRSGKYLLVHLDDGTRLVLHLGMTGQLFAAGVASVRLLAATARAALAPEQQRSFEPDRHTHLQLLFDDDPAVYLRDVRKFGKVRLLEPGETWDRLERLGVDALAATGDLLQTALRGRRGSIKAALLQQSPLAGVGNIYADEALFRSRIRPTRAAGRLTGPDCTRLAAAIRAVLERSIETGGTSISDYVRPDGRDGGFQDERAVYARAGEPCVACGTPIARTRVAQRSTHFCPSCQSR